MRRPAGRQAPPQEPLPELSSAARAFVTRACYFGVDQFLTDGLISVGCEASGGCEGSRRCVPCLERGTRSLSGGTTPALPTPPWSLHLLCEFLVKPLSPSSTPMVLPGGGPAGRRGRGAALGKIACGRPPSPSSMQHTPPPPPRQSPAFHIAMAERLRAI